MANVKKSNEYIIEPGVALLEVTIQSNRYGNTRKVGIINPGTSRNRPRNTQYEQ